MVVEHLLPLGRKPSSYFSYRCVFISTATSILHFLSLGFFAAKDVGVPFRDVFFFLLDSLKRTFAKRDRASVSVLEADCASADFTATAAFEEETRAGKTLPFSLSSSEDRCLKDTCNGRGELTVLS